MSADVLFVQSWSSTPAKWRTMVETQGPAVDNINAEKVASRFDGDVLAMLDKPPFSTVLRPIYAKRLIDKTHDCWIIMDACTSKLIHEPADGLHHGLTAHETDDADHSLTNEFGMYYFPADWTRFPLLKPTTGAPPVVPPTDLTPGVPPAAPIVPSRWAVGSRSCSYHSLEAHSAPVAAVFASVCSCEGHVTATSTTHTLPLPHHTHTHTANTANQHCPQGGHSVQQIVLLPLSRSSQRPCGGCVCLCLQL